MPQDFTDWRLDLRRGALAASKIFKYGLFPFASALPFAPWARLRFAVRFRRSLEELGLTYLKLGQFLALRFDILPAEVCLELNHLFESVPPMSDGAAEAIVAAELGAPIAECFAYFSAKPIAAASVGQVHEARLPDGRRVAVKIQRRGIMATFRADIRNLRKLTALGQRIGVFGRLDATGMIDQFEAWTLRELDFRIEGKTAERVRAHSGPAVVVPTIHWHLCSPRVLTMDFIDGVSATHIRDFVDANPPAVVRQRLPGFDFDTALNNFTDAALSQLFTDGFFHGDPHPGNILFLPDNRVVFLDFGIFGALSQDQRRIIAGQIESLALGNIGGSLRYYAQQVTATDDTDFDRFREDCRDVLNRWYAALLDPTLPIEERHLARYTGEMIDVSRRNGLQYDLNYLLFWRALNNLNGTLWHISPNYDLLGRLRIFFERTRPGPGRRVRATVADPAWRGSLTELARALPGGAAGAATGTLRVGASFAPSRDGEARRRRSAAVGAALLLLLPLAIAAASDRLPASVRAGLPLALGAALLWSRRQAR
ncbi:hypothetical protein A7X12_00345 [Sphingomonas sp. TDK1]|nr:hypothetical protein A7X12_00345 [Sphingomonas sp. TDK1]